jgi:UDP-glucose 4-epimerase
LRVARFFPEADDDPARRAAYCDANLKVNEFLHRRVDIEDVVSAHVLAAQRAPDIGFGRYIISATTPFEPDQAAALSADAAAVLSQLRPEYVNVYQRLGWRMYPTINRVYVNKEARQELGWSPKHSYLTIIQRLADTVEADAAWRSPTAIAIGTKGYHRE